MQLPSTACDYWPLDEIDQKLLKALDLPEGQVMNAFYTIGVVVEKTGAITAKSGKHYCTIKISSLTKYNTIKVKKIFEKQSLMPGSHLQILDKSFTNNGYKTLKIIAFGEISKLVANFALGTVIAVIGPRPLDQSYNTGVAVSIDQESQVLKIGNSQDLVYCKGGVKSNVTSLPVMGMHANMKCF